MSDQAQKLCTINAFNRRWLTFLLTEYRFDLPCNIVMKVLGHAMTTWLVSGTLGRHDYYHHWPTTTRKKSRAFGASARQL